MRYLARAPLRICLAGDGTDGPEFAEREGGAVLAAAITRYVTGRLNRPDWTGPLRSLRSDRSYLSSSHDVPLGAGLGIVAAQTVLWVTLMRVGVQNDRDRCEIAEISCRVSEALGILDGTGDEYAIALGGITYRTFGESARHETLSLDSATAEALRGRLILVYDGRSEPRAALRQTLRGRYRDADPPVVDALRIRRRLADDMKGALLMRDLDALPELIRDSWSTEVQVGADPEMEEIVNLGLRSGALAAKTSGPGDGCALFMTGAGGSKALAHSLASHGLRRIDFGFDTYGVFVIKE